MPGEINPQTNLIINSHRAKVANRVAKHSFQQCQMILRGQVERKFHKSHDLFNSCITGTKSYPEACPPQKNTKCFGNYFFLNV